VRLHLEDIFRLQSPLQHLTGRLESEDPDLLLYQLREADHPDDCKQ
jgi:hypothetical protein